MAKTVVTAIAAQKGGTGKTALAASLGPLWAYAGARVLLVDLDQQANLTYACAVDPEGLDATVVDVLAPRNPMSAAAAIVKGVHGIEGLDLLPCDERAEALDVQLRSETMGVYRLREVLEPLLERYDRIFVDCPPNVGELTISALLAASHIICPVNMGDSNALRGLSRLTRNVKKLRDHDAKVKFKSLVKVACDATQLSYRLNDEALKQVAAKLRLPVAETELRERAAWKTAVTQDLPLILLDQSERGTFEAQADIHGLACELWPKTSFPYPSEIRLLQRGARKVAA